MSELVSGESGWIIGFLTGLTVGIGLCRWLWINGQKHKRRLQASTPPESKT